MSTFADLVYKGDRTDHILSLARILTPDVDTREVGTYTPAEWMAVYSLLLTEYPDEVFLKRFFDSVGYQSMVLTKEDACFGEAMRYDRYSTTLIGERRVNLRFKPQGDSMLVGGIII